jgi:predicted transcriptional regulator
MATLTEPKVVVSAQIEREQREALEELAREQDRTISYLVRRAVDRYLAAETREANQ